MSKKVIVGLDIGTSFVRVAVSDPQGAREDGKLAFLGYGFGPASGVRRGAVVDVEETARSIREAVAYAERGMGISIDHAYVGFGGSGLGSVSSKGVVAVSRADGEISEVDLDRVRSAARSNLPQLPNKEIIHEFIVSYAVDKETNIKNPIGMIGTRLETEMIFLTAFTPHIKNLLKSVEEAGLAVDDVVAAPIASAQAILSKHQQEIGVMHLDMGGGTVSLAVFEEGALLSMEVFPVGSAHITNDIAIGFQVSLQVAEGMKVTHGSLPADVAGKDMFRLTDFLPETNTLVARKDLCEIIEARATDIFELTDKHLHKIKRSGLLPSGVVMTGGGAHLSGLVEFAKRELRLPAEVGVIRCLDGVVDLSADPSWATAVGLCLWGEEHGRSRTFSSSGVSGKLTAILSRWLGPLIP